MGAPRRRESGLADIVSLALASMTLTILVWVVLI
jgi:hypothetical protein